jgi:hypothetical protein
MTRTEAVSAVHRRLGRRSDLTTDIIAEMLLAQERLEQQSHGVFPWFLFAKDDTLTQTSGVVAAPTGFLQELEDAGLYYFDGAKRVQLVKDDFDYLTRMVAEGVLEESGTPTHYALVGTDFYLFPKDNVADRTYSLFFYKKADSLLQDNSTNGWLTHMPDLLISETGLAMSGIIRDYESAGIFKEMKAAAMSALIAKNAARLEAARAVYMGG